MRAGRRLPTDYRGRSEVRSFRSSVLRSFFGAQLDRVAVGIEDPQLTARAHVRPLEKLDAHLLERALGLLEVFDVECHVRAERVGLLPAVLARDDMQRVVADSVPGAAEAEVRPRNALQSDDVFVKAGRLVDIADAKRRMIERLQFDHNEFSIA